MGLLDRMDQALAAADWKMLKESRLGGIVMIGNNFIYCCALVYYFLERQLKTLKKCESWYQVQGKLLRLSISWF